MNIKSLIHPFISLIFCSLLVPSIFDRELHAQKSVDPQEMLFVDFSIPADTNLTQDQIRLSVGKKVRDIGYFSRIDPSSFNIADPNAWIVINQLRCNQALIILIDLNSLDNVALEHAKSIIKIMLKSASDADNQRLMLASLGTQLSFIQPFTSNKTDIISALDKVKTTTRRLDYKSLIESMANIFNVQYRQDQDQAIEESIREANIFLTEIRNRAETAVNGLEIFADWFQSLNGPKQVLLFSGGYPLKPGPVVQDILRTYNQNATTGIAPTQRSIRMGGGEGNITPGDTAASLGQTDSNNVAQDILSPALLSAKMGSNTEAVSFDSVKELITKFNRNQITLYAFDPRDIKADSLASSSIADLPSQLVGRHNSSHITAGREFLKEISEPTRGRLILDSGTLTPSFSDPTMATYLVGTKTDRKKYLDEIKEQVKIEIPGTDGQILARSSPFSLDSITSDQSLAGVFNFPGYYHDFSPRYSHSINKDEITGTVTISTRELGFTMEGNNLVCLLELFGLLTDSEGKPATKNKYTFAKQFSLKMNAQQHHDFLARGQVDASASAKGIPPGEYTLTTVVRQARVGFLAAAKEKATIE